MRGIKNIFRLPTVYIPLVLCISLATVLQLISHSVLLSCESSKSFAENNYTATVELTLIERMERVEDADTKNGYKIINTNTSIIDRNVLDMLADCDHVTDVDYYSRVKSFWLFSFCTEKDRTSILETVASGSTMVRDTEILVKNFNAKVMSVYQITDPAFIPEAYGERVDITYVAPKDGEGIIIPKNVYEYYGAPDTLLYGWFDFHYQSSMIQENGKYYFKFDHSAEQAAEYSSREYPAPIKIPVLGYYETDSVNLPAFCTTELAEAIYKRSYKFKPQTENEEHDVINDVGLKKITITLSNASKVNGFISQLEAKGLDLNDYQLYAHDYDYKFAVAQIEGIQNFALVLYYASSAFSVLVSVILIAYAVKKRSNEMYILRSIGEGKARVAMGITLENMFVCIFAVVAGTAVCHLFGNAICAAVNTYTLEKANTAAERLSEAAEFMRDADSLKMQLESAIESFMNAGYKISYYPPEEEFLFFPCLILGITVLSLLLTVITVNKNMMKREV